MEFEYKTYLTSQSPLSGLCPRFLDKFLGQGCKHSIEEIEESLLVSLSEAEGDLE
jgi:hypothetical protein